MKAARQAAQAINDTIVTALSHRSETYSDPDEHPVYYETYLRCHLSFLKTYTERLIRLLGREEEKSEGCD